MLHSAIKQKNLYTPFKKNRKSVGAITHKSYTPLLTLTLFTKQLEKVSIQKRNADASKHIHRLRKQVCQLDEFMLLEPEASAQIKFEAKNFTFDELVQEIVKDMQLVHSNHKICIESMPGLRMKGDRYLVGQVLMHLLSNAIKYSLRLSDIAVKVVCDDKTVTCSIQNNTTDTDFVWQKKVYEHFLGLKETTKDMYPSFGLGLYTAASIVNRRGGKIWLDYKKGKATCSFTLPLL